MENHFSGHCLSGVWCWRQLECGKKAFCGIVDAFCIADMLFLNNVIKNEESFNNAP
jgi:hypothetical protein